MTVAAVVVTYERKALLRQCLTALQAQTRPVEEIVVVDNASTDGTAAMVRSAFPEVTLRVLEENRGGAGGFHEGMKLAAAGDADWIWVMDDDAEPAEDALEQLLAPGLHERPDTVGLTSLKRFPSGTPQYDQTGWYEPHRARIEPITAADETVTEVGYSSFVGLLVPARVVKTIGLPDAGFFIWYDDVEYCLRLRTQGSLYLVRASVITHHVQRNGASEDDASTKKKQRCNYPTRSFWRVYYSYRNRLLILDRHASAPAERLSGWARILFVALRTAASILCCCEDKSLKLTLLAQSLLDGLRGQTGKRVDPALFLSIETDTSSPPAEGRGWTKANRTS